MHLGCHFIRPFEVLFRNWLNQYVRLFCETLRAICAHPGMPHFSVPVVMKVRVGKKITVVSVHQRRG